MVFNSINFMIFFPVVVLLYFVIPCKLRHAWLLIASYFFYMSWNPKYAIFIAVSTIITYAGGIGIESIRKNGAGAGIKAKLVLVGAIAVNAAILIFFKYSNFLLDNLNGILRKLHLELISNPFDLILPIGISFYTFQALGYIIDVYRGEKAEKNIVRYALFISFFPQLLSGPISRSKSLLSQINELPVKKLFSYSGVTGGLTLMLWGYFQKMVIADRIAVSVESIFINYRMFQTFPLLMIAIGFTIQIYCDFAGYSFIAVGAAKVMGFTITENFDTPYFSRSMKEFWRRWHISLSTWFRDYIYIPLGGSRCSPRRKYFNIMITFMISGLWHGASWNFVVWGALHGSYQVMGEVLGPVKNKINLKLNTKTESFSYKLLEVLITFGLTVFAWIFFRAPTLGDGLYYIKRIFTRVDLWSFFNGSIYQLGLDLTEMNILTAALICLFLVDLIKYKTQKGLDDFLASQCLWFRWGIWIVLVCSILVFGKYGPEYDFKQFIYSRF